MGSYMQKEKVVFVGIDLLPPRSEMIYSLICDVLSKMPGGAGICVSVNNHKRGHAPHTVSIPKFSRLFSGIALFATLFYLRTFRRVRRVNIFWSGFLWFDSVLIAFLKLIGAYVAYTIVNEKQCSVRGLGLVDKVIALSPEDAQKATLRSRVVTTVLPGVDCNSFCQKKSAGARFLFISGAQSKRHFSKRGVDFFFDLCAYASKHAPQIKFTLVNRWMAGAKFLESICRARGLTNVNIFNGVQKDMASIYAQSTGLLNFNKDSDVPSVTLSTLEALSCGCPIVATQDKWINMHVHKEKVGLLVKRDLGKIIDALGTIKKKRSFFSKQARRIAKRDFNTQRFIEQYLQALFK